MNGKKTSGRRITELKRLTKYENNKNIEENIVKVQQNSRVENYERKLRKKRKKKHKGIGLVDARSYIVNEDNSDNK